MKSTLLPALEQLVFLVGMRLHFAPLVFCAMMEKYTEVQRIPSSPLKDCFWRCNQSDLQNVDNKHEQKEKEQQQKQQQKPQPKMNQKEAEQRLKLLEQKEREVQERLQKEKSKSGGGQPKDW